MQLPISKKRKIYLTVEASEIVVHIPYRQAIKLIEPRIANGEAVNMLEFTDRERQVFNGLRRGLANKEIGSELNISERTVKFHVSAVYAKIPGITRRDIVRKFGIDTVAQGRVQ